MIHKNDNEHPNHEILIAISGCAGRMGRRLCALVKPPLRLIAVFDSPKSPYIGRPLSELDPSLSSKLIISSLSSSNLSCISPLPHVIIDFSSPAGSVVLAEQAAAIGIALIIGTTGLSIEQEAIVTGASDRTAIIHAANYSLGVNILIKIVQDAARALGEKFDVEIVEAHHNQKVDAPSGSALALADAICEGLGRTREDVIHGRSGLVGQRSTKEIGMHAVRLGSVVGDHTVMFGSEFERLELTHRAQSRDVFAAGALRSALWLAGKPPGKYTMNDVLFK